jgi:hypothetical protein
MGRVFDERKYLQAFLEASPEFQPIPGYITKEGLISFARWLIEHGYCKLGKEADDATIQVVLLYLHSKKLFEQSGRKPGDRSLYRINKQSMDRESGLGFLGRLSNKRRKSWGFLLGNWCQ